MHLHMREWMAIPVVCGTCHTCKDSPQQVRQQTHAFVDCFMSLLLSHARTHNSVRLVRFVTDPPFGRVPLWAPMLPNDVGCTTHTHSNGIFWEVEMLPCACIFTHVCICIYVCVCIYISIHVCVYTHTQNTNIYIHIRVGVCACVCGFLFYMYD